MKAYKKLEIRNRHHKKDNLTVATRKQQTVTPDGITSIRIPINQQPQLHLLPLQDYIPASMQE
jgi:hypothetical protein